MNPFTDDDAAKALVWLANTSGNTLQEVHATHLPCATETEWLDARRNGIGASEIGVIMGASTWTSPYALWWRKKLDWHIPRTESQRWGHLVEDPIATLFAEEMADVMYVGRPLGHPYSLWANRLTSWALCTPDRMAVDWGGVVYPVELKSDEGGEGWGEPGSENIPMQYKCQALWQAYVFEAPGTYVVRKRGSGKRRMVWYYVPRTPATLAVLIGRGWDFLTSIEQNNPPEPDGSKATTEVLRDINPLEPGAVAVIDDVLWRDWVAGRKLKREAVKAEEAASNRLRSAMGTAEHAARLTEDGMEVVFAKRRSYKRDGYSVEAGMVDELREVKSGEPPAGRPLPGPDDPGQAAASGEEEPPTSSGTGSSVGGGEGDRTGEEAAGKDSGGPPLEHACIHCGDHTVWADDPAPDLCAMCAIAGLWSPLWGPDQLADYQAMLKRLNEKRTT